MYSIYISLNNKFYIVTSTGKNKFYYYFTVSEFDELPTEENYNPISEIEIKWETTEQKKIGEIYNYILTQPEFAGGVIVQ